MTDSKSQLMTLAHALEGRRAQAMIEGDGDALGHLLDEDVF